MRIIDFLFGKKRSSQAKFRAVDWLSVEAKWRLIDQMASTNDQAQKKQAIIQADMLVDDILKQAGVSGKTMGERLKSIVTVIPRDLYHQLWQAHKKRNELVHESGSFVADWELSQYLNSFRLAISEMRGKK
jgi:hypothetical protein